MVIRAHTYPFDTVDNPRGKDDCNMGGAGKNPKADMVNHPPHYTQHPSGVECIQITEHLNFCLGNAVKYIWRAGLKSDDPSQDIEKAIFYLKREISRLRSTQP